MNSKMHIYLNQINDSIQQLNSYLETNKSINNDRNSNVTKSDSSSLFGIESNLGKNLNEFDKAHEIFENVMIF
jgi:hypothetical protein